MEKHVQLLSDTELKILEMLAEGYPYAVISNELQLDEPAVKEYINSMLQKQGFDNSYQLINWAYLKAIIL